MVTASAPGKVYLFGEHAVVYGYPAVPCAIEVRATVSVERRPADLRIHAGDLSLDGFTVEYDADTEDPAVVVPGSLAETATRYVTEAIGEARALARESGTSPDCGFDITIESDIPLAAGLGSSAAVVVATIAAATAELDVDCARAELAERAYAVERRVQDGAASRADTFCSTMGGAVRVEGEDCKRLSVPSLPFVVGYDGGGHETGELVASVRSLSEEYPFVAETLAAIGDLVGHGESSLGKGDVAELGRLLDINHGLLSALGVSARSLDEMVWTAREAGAAGAKLTGAGGGGCIVALDDSPATLRALQFSPACEEAFRADLDTAGVRVETDEGERADQRGRN